MHSTDQSKPFEHVLHAAIRGLVELWGGVADGRKEPVGREPATLDAGREPATRNRQSTSHPPGDTGDVVALVAANGCTCAPGHCELGTWAYCDRRHGLGLLGESWAAERGAAQEVAAAADGLDLQRLAVVAVVVLDGRPRAVGAGEISGPGQLASSYRSGDRAVSQILRRVQRRATGAALEFAGATCAQLHGATLDARAADHLTGSAPHSAHLRLLAAEQVAMERGDLGVARVVLSLLDAQDGLVLHLRVARDARQVALSPAQLLNHFL